MLLHLSPVMEFLRNVYVYTNFILEKLSREALVMGRVTAISNKLYEQSNVAALYFIF